MKFINIVFAIALGLLFIGIFSSPHFDPIPAYTIARLGGDLCGIRRVGRIINLVFGGHWKRLKDMGGPRVLVL
jgi:hypothetical protein